jgi:uncharacterized protein (TIGR03085 family)
MTRLSRTERSALCDLALQVGEDQPTLCGEWTVKDLVVHLLVRERSPAAAGIVVPALAGFTDAASRHTARTGFADLVERLRAGPPRWSPYAVPQVDSMFNTIEFFVHHEDIRRARPHWRPRTLSRRDEALLWRQVGVAGKGLVRNAPVGVALERGDKEARVVLKNAEPMVVVRGLPSELVLFVYGRTAQAQVELAGPDDAVAALTGADLGV